MEVKANENKLKGRISGIGLDLIPTDESEFKITHWMHKTGLTKIFKHPIDFDKAKIDFVSFNTSDSCNMIITLDNVSFEICQRIRRFI